MCIYETSMQLSINIAMIIYFIVKIAKLSCGITSRVRKETYKTWPASMLNVGIDGITQLIPLVLSPMASASVTWRTGGRTCGFWRAGVGEVPEIRTHTFLSLRDLNSRSPATC